MSGPRGGSQGRNQARGCVAGRAVGRSEGQGCTGARDGRGGRSGGLSEEASVTRISRAVPLTTQEAAGGRGRLQGEIMNRLWTQRGWARLILGARAGACFAGSEPRCLIGLEVRASPGVWGLDGCGGVARAARPHFLPSTPALSARPLTKPARRDGDLNLTGTSAKGNFCRKSAQVPSPGHPGARAGRGAVLQRGGQGLQRAGAESGPRAETEP